MSSTMRVANRNPMKRADHRQNCRSNARSTASALSRLVDRIAVTIAVMYPPIVHRLSDELEDSRHPSEHAEAAGSTESDELANATRILRAQGDTLSSSIFRYPSTVARAGLHQRPSNPTSSSLSSAVFQKYGVRGLAVGSRGSHSSESRKPPDSAAGVGATLPAATQEGAAERLGLQSSTYRYRLARGEDRIVAWLWQIELSGCRVE